ncbi:MAG TPA: type II toxin-antitoxin system RelE/ParE family toxin [Acidobacteriaceae bacterium]|nr:type II toxin-antitoxin system RelE/ParE family toxin [Acidobacteriaceae bacterium]
MAWDVEVSDEFREWYESLAEDLRASIAAGVDILEQMGPEAGRPFVDTLKGSKYPNLKELRIQHRGRPYRVLFILDQKRNVYLILGGDKSGNSHWYRDAIRRAENIYERYLKEIGGGE